MCFYSPTKFFNVPIQNKINFLSSTYSDNLVSPKACILFQQNKSLKAKAKLILFFVVYFFQIILIFQFHWSINHLKLGEMFCLFLFT